LLLAIAITGILMRYFTRVDILSVKQFALSMAAFQPVLRKRSAAFSYAISCWSALSPHISPSAN